VIKFKILPQHQLIVVSISEQVGLEELRDLSGRLTNDPEFVWNHDRIIFLRQNTHFSEMSFEALQNAKNTMKKAFFGDRILHPSELPAYRVAVVCEAQINAILMKLFGAIWNSDTASLVAVGHFETIPEALTWLERKSIPEAQFAMETTGT
jgi:hypothetical protein